jgi:hypothetical protein
MATASVCSGWAIPRAAADDSMCRTVGEYCGFYSPSKHIDCEIDTGGRVGPDSVYCKTLEPPQSVQMDNTGALRPCMGQTCLGNAAEGIPTLAYGETIALGPFECKPDDDAITCTAAGGRGFTISTSGIAAVG